MNYFPSNTGYISLKTKQKTTAHTTPNKFLAYLSDGIDIEFDKTDIVEGGQSYYAGAVLSVKNQYRGKIAVTGHLRPQEGAWLTGALFGKSTFTASAATTPNTHTITPKTTDLATTPRQPWMTFEKSLTGASDTVRYFGAKLSSFELTGEAGQIVDFAAEGTALNAKVVTTAQTDTYTTDEPFTFYDGTYYVNAPTTTSFDIKTFTIKFNFNNDEEIQTTGLTRQDIINHSIGAEVTLGLNYTDFNNWKLANLGSTSATTPSADYNYGSIKINLFYGSGANRRQYQMDIPRVELEPHDTSLDPAPNTLDYEMTGMALKQSTTEIFTVTAMLPLTTSLPAGI